MEIINERIRELRLSCGMSQEELAHACGYKNKTSITRIEAGQGELSPKKIEAFAKALGVTSRYLIYGEDPEINGSSDHRELWRLANKATPQALRVAINILKTMEDAASDDS